MQSHVDCIIQRPVCSVSKLKWVQQGSSNVLQVGTSLSNDFITTDVKATGLWSLSPAIFVFFGTGMMMENLKQEGTSQNSSDLLKINVKMDDSWAAQALRQAAETQSGPLAFLIFCLLKTLFNVMSPDPVCLPLTTRGHHLPSSLHLSLITPSAVPHYHSLYIPFSLTTLPG